jgi:hypothetical protein
MKTRFQFRLRTLFVVVTLAAVGCAYIEREWRIVREREAWLNAHARPPSDVVRILIRNQATIGDQGQSPGIVRRWLGDEGRREIWIEPGEWDEARRLFPETDLTILGEKFPPNR